MAGSFETRSRLVRAVWPKTPRSLSPNIWTTILRIQKFLNMHRLIAAVLPLQKEFSCLKDELAKLKSELM